MKRVDVLLILEKGRDEVFGEEMQVEVPLFEQAKRKDSVVGYQFGFMCSWGICLSSSGQDVKLE